MHTEWTKEDGVGRRHSVAHEPRTVHMCCSYPYSTGAAKRRKYNIAQYSRLSASLICTCTRTEVGCGAWTFLLDIVQCVLYSTVQYILYCTYVSGTHFLRSNSRKSIGLVRDNKTHVSADPDL